MRSATAPLELLEPRTLRTALRMLRDEPDVVPIAGCTDVYVSLNFGTMESRRFLNLWALDPLRKIGMDGDVLRIGALATYAAIMRSRHVKRRLPILIEAAGQIGGVQIQNRGTIGGNVANASPAGDTLPVLAVADATVVLRSVDAERRVPFNEFYTGYRASVRRSDELIVAIEIPPVDGRQWFRKVGTRAAQAISKIVIAAVRGAQPRIALGSVGPTVVRARLTEAALARVGDIAAAGRILASEITPIDDVRSTATYRREVAVRLLERFWSETA